GVPHGIEGVVGTVLFAVKRVGLNAKSVCLEQKRAALVMECVQIDIDIVVVAKIVSGKHMGSNQAGIFVVADKGSIKIFVCISQVCHGRFACGLPVVGIALDEVADP